MSEKQWIFCPVCGNKTQTIIEPMPILWTQKVERLC